MRYPLRLPAILLASAVALLSGCSSGDDNADARVRLLNVSSGYQALDFYVTEQDADTDDLKNANVGVGVLADYSPVPSGTYDLKFRRAGITSTLMTLSEVQLADDSNATYVAYGALGRFEVAYIDEDQEEPDDDGRAKLQAINASETGSVDIYLTEPEVPLEDASPMFPAGTGALTTTDSGTYRLRVTGPNDIDDLRLDVPSITLDDKSVATLILTETTGGVLVDALLLPQQGTLTNFKNSKARVRGAVGLLPGSTATLSVGGVPVFNNQGVGFISNYAEVEAGTVSVILGVSGTAIPIENQTLVAGGDYTMLLWNDANGVRATLIDDDNHLPTADDDAKIRLLNGYSTQSDPLNLLIDYAPVVEQTAVGAASIYAELDGRTDRRLDVHNATTTARVNTQEAADLDAGSVYTLFVIADASGQATSVLRKDRSP